MRGRISPKLRNIEIFKFGCFVSIPIVMMTYFRIPENVGHYVNRHNYVVYPPEADRSVIEPETIRERAKELRARVQK